MTPKELTQKVKDLSLPDGSYIVFGSGPLLIHGIRGCDDIDLLVSEEVYQKFKQKGWEEKFHGTDKSVLVNGINGIYEIGKDWKFGDYNPTLEDLLKTADVIEGVPFANLKEVINWKKAYNREKDWKDIELIEKYLGK